ncbi:glucose/sorbosone family PQQ-dependent dehydrogenase [Paeniglutamicibacter sp. ORCA_105]|uniref:glucose/sorbosone family PQQ-dependent dehydrogenase n=1 Tax=Paeniglutamicibacter sp. ORCA_105 TaxID=3377336 RepID=UPI003894E080
MKIARTLLAGLASIPLVLAMAASAPAGTGTVQRDDGGEAPALSDGFSRSVLATGLDNPFEVIYGPDDQLWVTERGAGRVTKIDPEDGTKTTILTIDESLSTPGEQDGLLGMALHPDLLKRGKNKNQYVYLSYTYAGDDETDALGRQQKIVRYTYDRRDETLENPFELLTALPASDDHNSGRLAIAPDGTLHYTLGDRGNNQDLNACRPNLAQVLPTRGEVRDEDWFNYQGKSLRMELDGDIPKDNPRINGVRSHVYTYGHRNAQGLVFADDGNLYSSEQGPKSDDEINELVAGGNYGWPNVAGFKDDSAYVFGDWSAAEGCGDEVPYDAFVIPDAVPQFAEHEFRMDMVQPLRTYYTVPDTHDFQGDACEPSGLFFICYPTIAPSNLDFYGDDEIPGWEDSLLMTTLKTGAVFRVELTDDGELDESQQLWNSVNRYRDTAINEDGKTIYVATDKDGLARGTNGDATTELEDPGAILVFTHEDDD